MSNCGVTPDRLVEIKEWFSALKPGGFTKGDCNRTVEMATTLILEVEGFMSKNGGNESRPQDLSVLDKVGMTVPVVQKKEESELDYYRRRSKIFDNLYSWLMGGRSPLTDSVKEKVRNYARTINRA